VEKLKFTAVVLGSGACLAVLVTLAMNINFNFTWQGLARDSIVLALFIITAGLLWLIAGETGWAGDFKSWKMGVQGIAARPLESFLFGAAAGCAAALIFYFFNWAFTGFLTLTAEALDRSAFATPRGLKFIGYEMSLSAFALMGLLGSLIVALSPTFRTREQRLAWLRISAALSLVLAAIAVGAFLYADAKYDFGKKNVAGAVGVPEKALSSDTLVLFKPGRAQLQEWPLEVSGYGKVGSGGSISLSRENLAKVEDYLEKHKEGSIYTFASHEILINGYFHLLDARAGLDRKFKSSKQALIPRYTLLSQLRYLPVVPENLRYLRAFTDEGQWHISGKYALIIAEGFMHNARTADAAAWVKKSKEKGADVSKATFLSDPVLTTGKVFGALSVNGRSPAHTRVALVRYDKYLDKISDMTLQTKLIDAKEPDASGRFVFDHLGKGEYLLLFVTDRETLPFKIPADKWKAGNAPGVIKLDTKTSVRNLGTITITFSKS
jgi:hypothetical protein